MNRSGRWIDQSHYTGRIINKSNILKSQATGYPTTEAKGNEESEHYFSKIVAIVLLNSCQDKYNVSWIEFPELILALMQVGGERDR